MATRKTGTTEEGARKTTGTSNATGKAAGGAKGQSGGTGAAANKQPRVTGTASGAAEGTAATGGAKAGGAKAGGAKAGGAKAGGAKAGGASAGGAKAGGAGAKRTAAPRTKKPDLRSDLRDFAAGRPQGWGHDDWVSFLEDLRARGHNVEDRDQVGHMLEQERLSLILEKVPGMGAQRLRSITEKFGNLWQLRQADADRIAREANVPRPLAEKVAEAVRG